MKAFIPRTMALLFAMVMVLALAACGESASPENGGSSAQNGGEAQNNGGEGSGSNGETVTLNFRHTWITEHEEKVKEIFEDIVNEFEQEHQNINIEMEGIDQETHRQQKLKAEMVAGNPPGRLCHLGRIGTGAVCGRQPHAGPERFS